MKLLKFGAKWCPGCTIMKPRLEEIENELTWLETEYHDADQDKDLAIKFELTDLPSFVFVDKENNIIEKLSGIIPNDKLIKLAQKYRGK